MNIIKKLLGFVWIALAMATIYFLISNAATSIQPNADKDINKPMPWIIIISVFIPIALGLMLFGWYAISGEYSKTENETN